MTELRLKIPITGVQYLEALCGKKQLSGVHKKCWYENRQHILNIGTKFHSFAAYMHATPKEDKYIVNSVVNTSDSDQEAGIIATVLLHSNGTSEPFDLPST